MFPIKLTAEGVKDAKISHFGTKLQVGHWHSDMPGLTNDAKVLAQSEGCPRQIIAYSNLVYGFQCHMEFNHKLIELLIGAESLENECQKRLFVQTPDEIRSYDFEEMNGRLFLFLDKLEEEYLSEIK